MAILNINLISTYSVEYPSQEGIVTVMYVQEKFNAPVLNYFSTLSIIQDIILPLDRIAPVLDMNDNITVRQN